MLDLADAYVANAQALICRKNRKRASAFPDPDSLTNPIRAAGSSDKEGITTILWATGFRQDF